MLEHHQSGRSAERWNRGQFSEICSIPTSDKRYSVNFGTQVSGGDDPKHRVSQTLMQAALAAALV